MLTDDKKAKLSKEYEEVHKRELPHMIGERIIYHAWDIQDLCQKYKAKQLLDFGCGKGYAYSQRKVHKMWGVDVHLYDIGIELYNKLPPADMAVDGVISCDVLEHIPEDEIDDTLSYWYSLNPRFVYASVAQYPAVAKLSDGSNAHVTLKQTSWWEDKFFKHLNCPTYVLYYPKSSYYIKHVYKRG